MKKLPHKFEIRLTNNDSNVSVTHLVEFAEEEWMQLREFVQYVLELEATKFVSEVRGVMMNLNNRSGGDLSITIITPPDDEVSAFIHKLRRLILQCEFSCFLNVRKLISRKLRFPQLVPFMRWLLDLYEGKESQKLISLESNGCIINSEEMLQIWLNAYEYHSDRDKRECSESHTKIMPLAWNRGVFLNLLIDKANAIRQLGALVELVLGRRDTLFVNHCESEAKPT